MIRIIIAGNRHFDNYRLLERKVEEFIAGVRMSTGEKNEPVTIVSGGAGGADSLGEAFARSHGYGVERFPADWAKYGRAAGSVRNRKMVESDPDGVIVFRKEDGVNKGSDNLVSSIIGSLASARGRKSLKLEIVNS